MRRYMKKQFVQSEIHCAEIVTENGSLTVNQLEPIMHLGSASKIKAQQLAERKYGKGVSVTDVKKDVEVRKMLSTKFYELSDPLDEGELPDEEPDDEEEETDSHEDFVSTHQEPQPNI